MIVKIIVGETGSGKTLFAKKDIAKYPNLCVYDRQGHDYEELPIFDPRKKQRRFRFIGSKSIDTIKKLANVEKGVRGYCFVIEEATGIFEGKVGKDWIDIALSKRHTNNRFYFIFHALHRVPMDLMEYADYVVLFKTNDIEKNIKEKYPNMRGEWVRICAAPQYTHAVIKKSKLAEQGAI